MYVVTSVLETGLTTSFRKKARTLTELMVFAKKCTKVNFKCQSVVELGNSICSVEFQLNFQ